MKVLNGEENENRWWLGFTKIQRELKFLQFEDTLKKVSFFVIL